MDNEFLDEQRRRIQQSLIKAKKEELNEKYGMSLGFSESKLPPEEEIEWLDHVREFERQFENAAQITVRERLGNPEIKPLADIPLHALPEAVEQLLERLYEHNIVVDFLGEFDDITTYRVLTEELMDEEMDDITIKDMYVHFPFSTDEYDVQMWVEDFLMTLYMGSEEDLEYVIRLDELYDAAGNSVTLAQWHDFYRAFWAKMPQRKGIQITPIFISIEDDYASVTAKIPWLNDENKEATFRLKQSPYEGWDVIQASFFGEIGE
ncbi:MAG: hypothetical protein AAF614_01150 [Chloroflexota bacterium]